MANPFDSGEPPVALTVSELNRQARSLLESHFDFLWVEGEVSNFAAPSSGHWYFSLKDARAQIRCAMFRNRNQMLKFRVEDGMKLTVRGRLSIYENRGDYQLIVEHLEESGIGASTRVRRSRREARVGKLGAEAFRHVGRAVVDGNLISTAFHIQGQVFAHYGQSDKAKITEFTHVSFPN